MLNFELEIQKLKDQIALLEREQNSIPTFSFSKITFEDLYNLVDIEREFDQTKFHKWLNFSFNFSQDEVDFLQNIIDDNIFLISSYKEEDLKIKVISPIINKIKFFSLKDKFRDFYEEPLIYKTDKFIFSGTTDFIVSRGLQFSQKPLFLFKNSKKVAIFLILNRNFLLN